MLTLVTPSEVCTHVAAARSRGCRIALVPTMGYLHEGHLSLIREAHSVCDYVMVSIFVNPTQFGPGEDLERYPRDLERDLQVCEQEGVAAVFTPRAEDMYAADHSVFVEEISLARTLCAASRPGHFRGVATVVAKLFNIVAPDVAVFGLKDAQQARVIEQLVRDLNFPVDVHLAPIVREVDGVAMSSRNTYLSADERAVAPGIYGALEEARRAFDRGERDARELVQRVRAGLDAVAAFRVEYVEAVAWRTLQPVERISEKTLVAVAVRLGRTRLIDNVLLG